MPQPHYPDDFRGLPREMAIPAWAHVDLEQVTKGEFTMCGPAGLSAVIDTDTGKIWSYVRDGKTVRLDVEQSDWYEAWADHPDGLAAIQAAITDAMEGV